MIDRVSRAVESLRDLVSRLDVGVLSSSEAAQLVEAFSEAERLCAAGRTLAAGRVQNSSTWSDAGFRTPAQWMAAHTRSSLAQAITTLENARRIEDLPETRDRFVSGRLSETQVSEIASAAEAHPESERSLLETAEHETFSALRDRCRDVVASARSDEDAAERIRRGRFLRHWMDPDGAVRLSGRFAPDDGARLVACVEAHAEGLLQEARRSGIREPADAHAADALVTLASVGGGARAVVHVEVDGAAFERGRLEPGERCRIRGIGPIPVVVARRLARDGVVKVLERDGVDVRRVAHAGRAISAHVRTAIEARDATCVVPGCDVRSNLEIDHVVPLADGGPTRLDNLARLCRYHHGQKTHRGWRLEGRPGEWRWIRRGASSGRSPPATPP